ncbi:MAG: hypothetical protein U1F36_20285 [Planctomycetota bacterium]
MSATNRVAFAGAFAIVGPLVLGMFLVMAVLGLAGLVALLLTGQLDSPGEGWFGVAVLLGVAGWIGWTVARGLRSFRVVDVAADGTWTLRNPWGLALARIPPDARRTLEGYRVKIWSFVGTYRRFTADFLEVRCGERTLRSCAAPPEDHARARRQLEQSLAAVD